MPLFAKALEFILPNGTDRWVGLLVTEPDEVSGTFSEVDDATYTRIAHDAWVTIDNGDDRTARCNSGAIVFPAFTDETTVSHWAIFDAENAGNLIAAGPTLNGDGVAQPATVIGGNTARFNDGDLKLLSSEVA